MLELTEDEVTYILENSSEHATLAWIDSVIQETTRFVNDGIELLDMVIPDWASRIVLERFNIMDADNCILAWVFSSSFYRGIDELSHEAGFEVDAEEYGFDYGTGTAGQVANFIWRQAIAERVK